MKNVNDGSQLGPLLDQVPGSLVSFTADSAYDQDGVAAVIAERHLRGGDHRAATLHGRVEQNGRD